MKVEYFPMKNWYISKRNIMIYLRPVSSCVIEKFLNVKRLDGCIQG